MKTSTTSLHYWPVWAIFCFLLVQCQSVPPIADPLVYVSADRVDVARKASDGCAFRYVIANSFGKLDNTLQKNAIKAGFVAWEKANANVAFRQFETTPRRELEVRFVDANLLQADEGVVPVGLVRGKINSISALRKESSTTYAILLSNVYAWDVETLTRAVSYHAGLYLGMNTSNDPQSVMYPFLVAKTTRLARVDSLLINQLYPLPCRDLSADFLPLSLKLLQPIVKTLKIEKQGMVRITASGIMKVGNLVGNSPPEGLVSGVGAVSLAGYSIVPTFNHACVMYRLNQSKTWVYCGKACEFPTNGANVDLELQVNDLDLTNNAGPYDIIIDYK